MSNIVHFPIGRQTTARVAMGIVAAALMVSPARAQYVSTLISSNLSEPNGVATDANNNLYISDSSDNRIGENSPAGSSPHWLDRHLPAPTMASAPAPVFRSHGESSRHAVGWWSSIREIN